VLGAAGVLAAAHAAPAVTSLGPLRRRLFPGLSDCTSAPDSWRRTLGALPSLLEDVRTRDLAVGPLRDHAISGPAA
jgi:hypothetical protein